MSPRAPSASRKTTAATKARRSTGLQDLVRCWTRRKVRALSTVNLQVSEVVRGGLEPPTIRFSVRQRPACHIAVSLPGRGSRRVMGVDVAPRCGPGCGRLWAAALVTELTSTAYRGGPQRVGAA